MATTFAEIRDLIRPILGDDDSQNYLYTDETLNQHIRLQTFAADDPNIEEDGISESFTQTLAGKTRALIAYEVARGIVSSTPDYFQYRNPVMSATRSGGAKQLISHCEVMISKLQGGFLALKEDNEHFVILSLVERWERDYDDGIEYASQVE